ncbi:jg15821 [Pararge aegeria aegeria]|uniref:Jg15821 protein n=1 Tax=Pararge aegeria aegeria TaxID=348720 RepID=A0A8S4QNQ3_9NEOP|nr:jg15821 [Pararge aegeria aegeria]
MVRPVYATLLVLSMTTHARSQFFDFFSALQPYGQQTLRPIFQIDFTTKRIQTTRTTKRPEATTKRTPLSFYSQTTKRPETTTKRNTKNAPLIYDFFSTTVKPSRKTTKGNPTRRHYENNSRATINISNNKGSKETSRTDSNRSQSNKSKIGNTRNVNVNAYNNNRSKPNNSNNDDRLIFDDVRPGVRPAIVNGPPITNRPATQRPSFGPRPEGDDDVSPELIIGPNEDYMSTVDKKRYIEMAEKKLAHTYVKAAAKGHGPPPTIRRG